MRVAGAETGIGTGEVGKVRICIPGVVRKGIEACVMSGARYDSGKEMRKSSRRGPRLSRMFDGDFGRRRCTAATIAERAM